MESKNRQRDYLFDNYKVLLIILVIIGHFTEPSYRNNDFLYTLKWLIVSFHMPAFIFISGYFSKRELTFAKLFQKLVIPYLIYEFIYYFFYIYVLHKETSLYLLYPSLPLVYFGFICMESCHTVFQKASILYVAFCRTWALDRMQ